MAERIERLEKIVETLVEALGDVFIPREVRGSLEPGMWIRTQEYFDYDEAVALPVTIAPAAPHEFKEKPVKFLWLYAAGAPIQVSLNRAVSGDSFIVPNGAIIWVPRLTRRVYGIATVGAGILYLWGFW